MPVDVRIEIVVSELFGENCYLVYVAERSEVVLIDPGLEPDAIIAAVDKLAARPTAILITHGHADHIAGNAVLKERWPDCPVIIGEHEAEKLVDPRLNLSQSFGMPIVSPPADRTLRDGEEFQTAGLIFRAIEIPGHSTGHVVYLLPDGHPMVAFVGDVIFAGSVGRTDFPGGSFAQLAAGIRQQLYRLPDDTVLYPGHGPQTTVGREKRSNPFVAESG